MESLFESLTGLVAIVCSLGIPVVVIVMAFIAKMRKDKQQKEIRQLIIENHTDPETAKLLIEQKEAKEPRKPGTIDLGTLRTACILLGIGLGAMINWIIKSVGFDLGTIYFWLIIAFGIGVGMLCSFIVEMRLYKKQKEENPAQEE